MSLREQIAADVEAVFLITDDFAETCTYTPKDGAARSVVAVVDEDGQDDDQGNGLWRVEILNVWVSRDPDTGIATPQLGDGIVREDDDADKGYAFSGIKSDADQFAWTLQFTRKTPLERGGNRMR